MYCPQHVSVSVYAQVLDVDWWRAVTHRKGGCQHALYPLPCSLSALQSAQHWCQCVRDVCWACVDVLALIGNDFEKHRNTPNSQYHPISPYWNQHSNIVIGWKCVVASVFQCSCTFWQWLVSCWWCAEWSLMTDYEWVLQERLSQGLSFGSLVSECELCSCMLVRSQCASIC